MLLKYDGGSLIVKCKIQHLGEKCQGLKSDIQYTLYCLYHVAALYVHYIDRGWYLGETVGSWFCSCKTLVPNPKAYVFHAQAKSRFATKVVSRVHIRLLQNLCIL